MLLSPKGTSFEASERALPAMLFVNPPQKHRGQGPLLQ